MDEVGTFFIDRFLPHCQARVQAECNNADLLADYSLIGHSAGGLVVNWILRVATIPSTLRKVITVAAPFYGDGRQLHRWFEGEPLVNVGGAFTTDIIKALSSFPGCYSWHFLPARPVAQGAASSPHQGDCGASLDGVAGGPVWSEAPT